MFDKTKEEELIEQNYIKTMCSFQQQELIEEKEWKKFTVLFLQWKKYCASKHYNYYQEIIKFENQGLYCYQPYNNSLRIFLDKKRKYQILNLHWWSSTIENIPVEDTQEMLFRIRVEDIKVDYDKFNLIKEIWDEMKFEYHIALEKSEYKIITKKEYKEMVVFN
jgi:hypothetical protein